VTENNLLWSFGHELLHIGRLRLVWLDCRDCCASFRPQTPANLVSHPVFPVMKEIILEACRREDGWREDVFLTTD
jgi:hypothetical protein